jgi:hypothetical protein
LSCHRIDGNIYPLQAHLFLNHLNPLIAGAIEEVDVWEPQQLCTPVRKNSQFIPSSIIDFVRYLDLKCYRLEGPGALTGLDLSLTHLNPEFPATWSPEPAHLYNLSQLCVPVQKLQDGVIPQPIPPPVIDFIRNVDLACYDIEDPNVHPFQLRLTELNPMFNFPTTSVTMYYAHQLCLPVQKSFDGNFPALPPPISDVVSQLDFLRYEVFGDTPDYNYFLGLRHLNPLLADFPDEFVLMHEAMQLMVPVSKSWPGMAP